jgi:hypothetical protein
MTIDDYRRPHQLQYGENPVRTWPRTVARAAFVYGIIGLLAVVGLCLVKWLIPTRAPSAAFTGPRGPVMIIIPLLWLGTSATVLNFIFTIAALCGTISQPLRRVRQLSLASLAMGIVVLAVTQMLSGNSILAGIPRAFFDIIHVVINRYGR